MPKFEDDGQNGGYKNKKERPYPQRTYPSLEEETDITS